MEFNEILKWLRNYDFNVQHSEHFYPQYVFCKKDQINIVLKEYHSISRNEIRSDSVDVRDKLNELNENVWNTYFLICSYHNTSIPYSLEKDSTGVRKYVINTLDDIKRIPFLDIITTSKPVSSTNNITIHTDQNKSLDKIIDHVISFDGLQRGLVDKEVSEIIYRLINERENMNEN